MRARTGITIPELLLALAILAGAALLAALWWPSPLGPASNALRTFISQARLEAVTLNEPIAVVFDPALSQYRQLRGTGGTFSAPELCSSGQVLRTLNLSDYRGVRPGSAGNGIVWLPTGYARTCVGGGASNQTLTLTNRNLEARIFVSRAGRLRTEVDIR